MFTRADLQADLSQISPAHNVTHQIRDILFSYLSLCIWVGVPFKFCTYSFCSCPVTSLSSKHGRHSCRGFTVSPTDAWQQEINLRIILEWILCERVDWIHLAQCRAHLRTHVNMIMKLRSKNFNLRIILRVNFVSESGLDSFGSV